MFNLHLNSRLATDVGVQPRHSSSHCNRAAALAFWHTSRLQRHMPCDDSNTVATQSSQNAFRLDFQPAHLLKSTSSSALLRAETLGESIGETLGVPPCDWLGVSGRSSEGAGLASLPGCLIQYVNPCREHRHRSHPDAQEAQRSTARLTKMAV